MTTIRWCRLPGGMYIEERSNTADLFPYTAGSGEASKGRGKGGSEEEVKDEEVEVEVATLVKGWKRTWVPGKGGVAGVNETTAGAAALRRALVSFQLESRRISITWNRSSAAVD